MMLFLEVVLVVLIVILCYMCTKSDLQNGMIYNKVLFLFFIAAITIDVIYYGFFVTDLAYDFLGNIIFVSVVSLYLFYSHVFAGGDCKMIIVISFLFPARFYWRFGSSNITLVFAIAFAIFAGYCYLLAISIHTIAKKKTVFTVDYIKENLFSFIKSYILAIVYISLLNYIIILFLNQGYNISVWIARIICLVVALCIGKYTLFKKWFIFVPSVIAVIIISIATNTIPVSVNLGNYIFILFLLFAQMSIRTTIYEKISIEQLKKGMILTTFSSMLMQTSLTKGLPDISTEDLKSRLTNEEISSIKKWAKITHTDTVTIVKKIPFAIFISIGMLLYCAMWGLL